MGDAEADCQALIEQLYLVVDGELAEGDLRALERHLQLCAGCAHHVDFERALKEFVQRRCSERDLPEGFLERVRAVVRSQSAGEP